MKRGELYVAAPPGEYGKPRPVVVVQSDLFIAQRNSITVCLLTSDLIDAPLFRVRVNPGPSNQLKNPSDVMADKLMTLTKGRFGARLGALNIDELAALDQSLRRWLALP